MDELMQNQGQDMLDGLNNPAIDAYRLENDRRKNPEIMYYGQTKLLDSDEFVPFPLFFVFTEFRLYYEREGHRWDSGVFYSNPHGANLAPLMYPHIFVKPKQKKTMKAMGELLTASEDEGLKKAVSGSCGSTSS